MDSVALRALPVAGRLRNGASDEDYTSSGGGDGNGRSGIYERTGLHST